MARIEIDSTPESEALAFLSTYSFTNRQMDGLLAWVEDNQANGEIATKAFLIENEVTWLKWVIPEFVQKAK